MSENIDIQEEAKGIDIGVSVPKFKKIDDRTTQNITKCVKQMLTCTAYEKASVRVRAFEEITRMAKKNLLSLELADRVLQCITQCLTDSAKAVRIAAVECSIAILRYNQFSIHSSFEMAEIQLTENHSALLQMQTGIEFVSEDLISKYSTEWNQLVDAITTHSVSAKTLEKNADTDNELNVHEMVLLMVDAIRVGDYANAFKLSYAALYNSDSLPKILKPRMLLDIKDFIKFMEVNYVDVLSHQSTGRVSTNISLNLHSAKARINIDYLNSLRDYLNLIREVWNHVTTEMIISPVVDEHPPAVAFITAAFQRDVDHTVGGIMILVRYMDSENQKRKAKAYATLTPLFFAKDDENSKHIEHAFEIVLFSELNISCSDHTNDTIERLLKIAPYLFATEEIAMSLLISKWIKEELLTEDMISTLWDNVFDPSAEQKGKSSPSLALLLSIARSGHINVLDHYENVMVECFDKRALSIPCNGEGDIFLAIEALRFLQLLKIPIQNEHPMWKKQMNTLRSYATNFSETHPVHMNRLVTEMVRCIFTIAEKPIDIIELVIDVFSECMELAMQASKRLNHLPKSITISWNFFISQTAASMNEYLQCDHKESTNNADKKGKKRNKKRSLPESHNAFHEVSGCRAANADAVSKFINQLFELLSTMPLRKFGSRCETVMNVVRMPNSFPDSLMQKSAICALMRSMLLSSGFCAKNINLVIIRLLSTNDTSVKIKILERIYDLASKFPHIMDPYGQKVLGMLADSSDMVRKLVLNALSQFNWEILILTQDHMWKIAICIVDDSQMIREAIKNLFHGTIAKTVNKMLYKQMPDMFTHFCRNVSDVTKLRCLLCFLLELIDNGKQIEWLIEKFCMKFTTLIDNTYATHLAFALAQMPYDEHALRKLLEHFPRYKHFLQLAEVHECMKSITTKARLSNQEDLETTAMELDKKLKTFRG